MEHTVIISAFGSEWEVKVKAFDNMPQDRLKELAIQKLIMELKDVLLQENGIIEKTSFVKSEVYAINNWLKR